MASDELYFQHGREEMLVFVPKLRRRILEIGCGQGNFSAALDGVEERWGVEPSNAADVATTRLTHVLKGTFDQVRDRLPLSYFDLVVCNDVIEHMPDHAAFLSDIRAYIAPGGVLIGSIPNVRFYENLFSFLLEKDWRYTDAGILDRTHLAFFTEKSLRRILERSGFEILNLRGINTDFIFGWSTKTRAYRLAAQILSVLSFGYFSDMRHLQFGFQAKPLAEK